MLPETSYVLPYVTTTVLCVIFLALFSKIGPKITLVILLN